MKLSQACLFALLFGGGCVIDAPHFVLPDGPAPDAAAEVDHDCEPDTITCDAGRYVECSPEGDVTRELTCTLGCAEGVPKCLDIDPSNGLGVYLDLTTTDPNVEDVVFAGASTIDTDSGDVVIDGVSVPLPSTTFGSIRIFWFRSLSLGGTVKVTGDHALALLSDGDVLVAGVLDVSADLGVAGPGAFESPGPCEEQTSEQHYPGPGGTGGGRFHDGGAPGAADDGYLGPDPYTAPAYQDDDLDPLVGGCRGGLVTRTGANGVGGGGGGAVQIVSRTRIDVGAAGFAGSVIDASGGGAKASNPTPAGGPGGGAGGGILLEAPAVVLAGDGVLLSTRGGGGGSMAPSAEPGNDGVDGGIGTLNVGGQGGAGVGGYRSKTALEPPTPGAAAMGGLPHGAGGGGSVGQVRFNTAEDGLTLGDELAIQSAYSSGPIRTRLYPSD